VTLNLDDDDEAGITVFSISEGEKVADIYVLLSFAERVIGQRWGLVDAAQRPTLFAL
jgi:hypothetical protein